MSQEFDKFHAAAIAFIEDKFNVSFFTDSWFIADAIREADSIHLAERGIGLPKDSDVGIHDFTEFFVKQLDAHHKKLKHWDTELTPEQQDCLVRGGMVIEEEMEANLARSLSGRLDDTLHALSFILNRHQKSGGGDMIPHIAFVETAREALRSFMAGEEN